MGQPDILGNYGFCTLSGAFGVFVIKFVIMITVHIPNQTNGAYDARVEFDTLDDALALVADELDTVYNNHAIIVNDGTAVIGCYHGRIQHGLRPYSFDNDFGPVL